MAQYLRDVSKDGRFTAAVSRIRRLSSLLVTAPVAVMNLAVQFHIISMAVRFRCLLQFPRLLRLLQCRPWNHSRLDEPRRGLIRSNLTAGRCLELCAIEVAVVERVVGLRLC